MDFSQNLTQNMTGDTLRNLLRALGEKRLPGRKAEMAARLQQVWQAEPQRLVDQLTEPEIKLLAECVHEGYSSPDADRINARYGFSYSIPYYVSYGEAPFVLCFIHKPDRYSDYELVSGVEENLKKCIPAPPPLEVKLTEPPSEKEAYMGERIALVEAKRVLQLVAAGKLKVSEKTRLPSAACIKQVKSCLCEPETLETPRRALAWPVLIQQCGWAKPRAGKLLLTRKGKALLENFTPEGYAAGVQSMIYDSAFDEMYRAPEIKGMKGRRASRCRMDAATRRHSISDAFSGFPAGKWVKIEDAFDYVIASGNSFCVVEDGYTLYIGDARYGTLNGLELDIARVYFRILVAESFATLGLFDWVVSESDSWGSPDLSAHWGDAEILTDYDEVSHIRLTPLGAFCLEATTSYEMPKAEKRTLFNVLPNHEIVVTDAAAFSAADAALLERFAGKTADSVWKMSPKSIFQALENGDSADDILAVLQAGSANEIPQTVHALIAETVARSGAATRREEAVAVTFRDEHTAALVEHESTIRPTLFCRHGNTVFVRAKNLKKFQGGLRKLGILLP